MIWGKKERNMLWDNQCPRKARNEHKKSLDSKNFQRMSRAVRYAIEENVPYDFI